MKSDPLQTSWPSHKCPGRRVDAVRANVFTGTTCALALHQWAGEIQFAVKFIITSGNGTAIAISRCAPSGLSGREFLVSCEQICQTFVNLASQGEIRALRICNNPCAMQCLNHSIIHRNYTCTATPVDSQGVQGTPASTMFLVEAPAGPAQLSEPTILPDGRLQFTINGVADHQYDVQATSTLPDGWATVATIEAPSISFPFAEAAVQGPRYYRVVTR